MRILIVIILALMVSGLVFLPMQELSAQTYAAPELKMEAEKHDAEKASRLLKEGKSPASQPAVFTEPASSEMQKVSYTLPIDVNSPALFKLSAVKAIDIDSRHTDEQMSAFTSEAGREFDTNNIVINWEDKTWYTLHRAELKYPLIYNFEVENNILKLAGAPSSSDNTYTVVDVTQESLILQLRPQDSKQFFVYQFEFIK